MVKLSDDLLEKARRVQADVREREREMLREKVNYADRFIQQTIVQTRQDVGVLVSLLSDVAGLMQEIVLIMRVFFWAFIAYLIYLAYSSFIA